MILSRRKAHFISFSILVVLLPIIFVAGTLTKPKFVAVDESTDSLYQKEGFSNNENLGSSQTIAAIKSSEVATEIEVKTLVRSGDNTNNLILEIEPNRVVQLPDLLLYWQPGSLTPQTITNYSVLLGTLSGTSRRQFNLPANDQGTPGHLIIYSQGVKEFVAVFPFTPSVNQASK